MPCSLTQPRSEAQERIPLSDAVITEAVNNAYSAKAKAGADPTCKSLFRVADSHNVIELINKRRKLKLSGTPKKDSRLQLVIPRGATSNVGPSRGNPAATANIKEVSQPLGTHPVLYITK